MEFFIIFFYFLAFSIYKILIAKLGCEVADVMHERTLVFELGSVAPDNFKQEGILVNGVFPGPTLRLRQNVTLTVNVVNKLPRGLAIHFHGILQSGTVSSDGVPGVTQYEIPPNGTYRYSMKIGQQSGTFMYHAHTGLDQNWAMGAMVIQDNPAVFKSRKSYAYDYEETFILSQCWHIPITEITAGVLGSPFQDVPDTDSLLINGRSYGEWATNEHGESEKDDNGYLVITVKPNATYRFRVIGLGVDSMLTFHVSNHSLKIIEMDGILVDPVKTDHLEINSAQRYSALIKMNQPIGNYWIQTTMIPGSGPANGRAILHYDGAPYPTSMRKQTFEGQTPEIELTEWIQEKLYPSSSIPQPLAYAVPREVDKEIVIASQQIDVKGERRFDINGHLYGDYDPPILHQIRSGVNFTNKEPRVFEVFLGESLQVVFVNRMSDDGECEQHPWHFHGHTFHVVGQGPDDYDPSSAKSIIDANIDENRNQFRDVVTLFPNQSKSDNSSGVPCGWVAVRLVLNNPGVWIVHCHLTAHMLMGKVFVLYEHTHHDPQFSLVI